MSSSRVRISTLPFAIISAYARVPWLCRTVCWYSVRMVMPRSMTSWPRLRAVSRTCSLRPPPGWTVSTSDWHSWVARSMAALMRSMPSCTVTACVSPGLWALMAMNGSKESVSSLAS